MKTHDFYYDLPEELIAQTPLDRRDGSRLLVLDKQTGARKHMHFYELPQLLRPGDCLVMNDSRVLPARLLGHREPGGGACEVLLLVDRGEKTWECLVRPGKKMRTGAKLTFGDGTLRAEVTEELPRAGTVWCALTMRGFFWKCWNVWVKCRSRLISRRNCRSGTVSNCIFQGGWFRGCAYCGASFYQRVARPNRIDGREALLCYASCRPRDISSCKGR